MDGVVQFVWELETECGRIVRCSDEHKWPSGLKDRRGRKAGLLQVGDTLLNQEFELTTILRKEKVYPTEQEMREYGGIPVRRIWIQSPHLYIANELLTLNTKQIDTLP